MEIIFGVIGIVVGVGGLVIAWVGVIRQREDMHIIKFFMTGLSIAALFGVGAYLLGKQKV